MKMLSESWIAHVTLLMIVVSHTRSNVIRVFYFCNLKGDRNLPRASMSAEHMVGALAAGMERILSDGSLLPDITGFE